MKSKRLAVLLLVVIGSGFLGWYWREHIEQRVVKKITSFDECVAAGNRVMESYPRQCRANGELFVEKIENDMEQAHEDLRLFSPRSGEVVSSPLTVRGDARGSWFFEADFPVVLTNWDGLIIGEGIAAAILDPSLREGRDDPNDPESTWMTEEFVPFEAVIEFEDPSWDEDFSKRGWLILKKDNPSSLPEFDDAVEVEVRF